MVSLKILFPSDYFDKKSVDKVYKNEMEIAKSLGFDCMLFPYDEFLEAGKFTISESKIYAQPILYRGWMLKIEEYRNLENILHSKGYSLINNSEMYKATHYFDEAYSYIHHIVSTPNIVNIKVEDDDFQWYGLEFGKGKLNLKEHFKDYFIMKDNVKSVKGTDFPDKISVDISNEELLELTKEFIKLRGNLFTHGLVLKQYEPLKKYADTTNEWRVFYFLNRLMTVSANSNQKNTPCVPNELIEGNWFKNLPSLFFTADFAEKENGEWILIETGDGQVSGLSPNQNILEFYSKIKNYWIENKRGLK